MGPASIVSARMQHASFVVPTGRTGLGEEDVRLAALTILATGRPRPPRAPRPRVRRITGAVKTTALATRNGGCGKSPVFLSDQSGPSHVQASQLRKTIAITAGTTNHIFGSVRP